jgi:WhiB family redox-sensing transcriptional regulator
MTEPLFAPDDAWRDDAACKGRPNDWFFTIQLADRGRQVCARCPVRKDCLADAMEFQTPNSVGDQVLKETWILGGLSWRERETLKKRRQRDARKRRRAQEARRT